MGPSNVKDHSITTDISEGFLASSRQRQRGCPSNMALISQEAKREPHPLTMKAFPMVAASNAAQRTGYADAKHETLSVISRCQGNLDVSPVA